MNAWLEYGASNGVAAVILAMVAALATVVFRRRAQVAYVLWALVLAKLVAPPLVALPLGPVRSYVIAVAEYALVPAASHVADQDAANSNDRGDPLLGSDLLDVAWSPATIEPTTAVVDEGQLDARPFEAEYLESPPRAAALDVQELAGAADDDLARWPALDDGAAVAIAPAAATMGQGAVSDAAAVEPAAVPWRSWLPGVLLALWLAGTASWCLLAAARMARFARLLRYAGLAGDDIQAEVRRLSAQLGLARPPVVRVAQRRIPPLVWAMGGRPTMLLPAELLAELSPRQRETLLAHELAHLARRDYLVRWLELAAVALYWWHPVAWWARHNLAAAEEQCCDARVLALLPGSARAYAETLLATLEFLAEPGRPLPLGASGFSQLGHVHRRLTMILTHSTTGRLAWPLRAGLLAVTLLVLPLSLRTLWAEPAPADAVAEAVAVEEEEVASDTAAASEAVEQVEEAAAPVEPLSATETVGPVEPVEAVESVDPVEPAEAVESVAPVAAVAPVVAREGDGPVAAAPKVATAVEDNAIERRLDRLERMIEKLVADRHGESSETKPAPVAKRRHSARPVPAGSPTPAAKPAPAPKPAPAVKPAAAGTPAPSKLLDEGLALEEWEDEVKLKLADAVKQAKMGIDCVQTNSQRVAATDRQLEAVLKALAADTVTVDEALEAIRRRADAEATYAKTVAALAGDGPKQHFLAAASGYVAARRAADATKKVWQEVESRGKVSEEAQCREQYQQLRDQLKSTLQDVEKAKAGVREGRTMKDEGQRQAQLAQWNQREQSLALEKQRIAEQRQQLEDAAATLKAEMAARTQNLEALEQALQQKAQEFEHMQARVQVEKQALLKMLQAKGLKQKLGREKFDKEKSEKEEAGEEKPAKEKSGKPAPAADETEESGPPDKRQSEEVDESDEG
ncbi:MAG: M56 family metallopeptidase [Pirellulales bacterium]